VFSFIFFLILTGSCLLCGTFCLLSGLFSFHILDKFVDILLFEPAWLSEVIVAVDVLRSSIFFRWNKRIENGKIRWWLCFVHHFLHKEGVNKIKLNIGITVSN